MIDVRGGEASHPPIEIGGYKMIDVISNKLIINILHIKNKSVDAHAFIEEPS